MNVCTEYRCEIIVGMMDRVCSLTYTYFKGRAHMSGEKKIENLRTLHEAAEHMGLKPRTLAKAARKIGACSVFGRDIHLSEDDVKALWEAHRASPKIFDVDTPSASHHQTMKRLEKLLAKPTGKIMLLS